ncbi:hypothetical protein JNB62_15850 [Microbacterium jejuense]|uniref:Uncharacterized protein n=1 Tax=Microbacterium jejuense TaxID=1263637 RepID=A0ABS7HRV3_9MICO|nr:hypothetical protein [Microbacterium jejuense]MBW9095160.1 hypothetical protein [Microbacterium jejuense]
MANADDTETMDTAEAFQAARESFFHAERVSLEAVKSAASRDQTLWELADAVNSIAYGLKILTSALEGQPKAE